MAPTVTNFSIHIPFIQENEGRQNVNVQAKRNTDGTTRVESIVLPPIILREVYRQSKGGVIIELSKPIEQQCFQGAERICEKKWEPTPLAITRNHCLIYLRTYLHFTPPILKITQSSLPILVIVIESTGPTFMPYIFSCTSLEI